MTYFFYLFTFLMYELCSTDTERSGNHFLLKSIYTVIPENNMKLEGNDLKVEVHKFKKNFWRG